jgi:hypothetical protein
VFPEAYYACFAVTADENLSVMTLSGETDADLYVWPMAHIVG